MRNTVSQSEPMAPERSLTVALKRRSATHTNWYLSLIAAIPPKLDHSSLQLGFGIAAPRANPEKVKGFGNDE
jgi:hypothetical protein